MRLHVDKSVSTPAGTYQRGQRVDVPDEVAMSMIKAGQARNVVIWLASLAAEEGFDIKPKKKSKKLEDLLSF